ncbi:putative metal-binding protein [Kibdelosporangium phytohabitans]|nr:putative metal-binding protein [Kibdelosporangium phytohabitans]
MGRPSSAMIWIARCGPHEATGTYFRAALTRDSLVVNGNGVRKRQSSDVDTAVMALAWLKSTAKNGYPS